MFKKFLNFCFSHIYQDLQAIKENFLLFSSDTIENEKEILTKVNDLEKDLDRIDHNMYTITEIIKVKNNKKLRYRRNIK